MSLISRFVAAVIAAVLMGLPAIVEAGPRSHPLNEDAALDLLERTLKRDHVYTHRISWDCISYGTEETTDAYFDFVLREIHNAKCGGAPEWMPVIDRYRVYRRSGKIQWWEPIEGDWRLYDPTKIR
jgi:hypothetical protein